MIRLYFDPDGEELHIGAGDSGEIYCGIQADGLRPIGTVGEPESFTPAPDSVHDRCLAEFDRRHGFDPPSRDDKSGWVDMREPRE